MGPSDIPSLSAVPSKIPPLNHRLFHLLVLQAVKMKNTKILAELWLPTNASPLAMMGFPLPVPDTIVPIQISILFVTSVYAMTRMVIFPSQANIVARVMHLRVMYLPIFLQIFLP